MRLSAEGFRGFVFRLRRVGRRGEGERKSGEHGEL